VAAVSAFALPALPFGAAFARVEAPRVDVSRVRWRIVRASPAAWVGATALLAWATGAAAVCAAFSAGYAPWMADLPPTGAAALSADVAEVRVEQGRLELVGRDGSARLSIPGPAHSAAHLRSVADHLGRRRQADRRPAVPRVPAALGALREGR
jgi:hypothetical protein